MIEREVQLVVDICREVDWLVSADPLNASVEVLERYRLQMNDLLMVRKWREAEGVAYRILLLREGRPIGADWHAKTES